MGTVVLDASVIIAFFSEPDAHHERALGTVNGLLGGEDTVVVPASVYSEVLVHAIREGRPEHIDAFIDRSGFEITPIGRSIGRHAATVRANYAALRLPDALTLATTIEHGGRLITLDQRLQQIAEEISERE